MLRKEIMKNTSLQAGKIKISEPMTMIDLDDVLKKY
jgi:hypothetical protein